MSDMNPYTFALLIAGYIIITSVAVGVIGAAIDSGGAPLRTSLLVACAYAAGIFTAVVGCLVLYP